MEMELSQPVNPCHGASSQSYIHKQLFQSFSCFFNSTIEIISQNFFSKTVFQIFNLLSIKCKIRIEILTDTYKQIFFACYSR